MDGSDSTLQTDYAGAEKEMIKFNTDYIRGAILILVIAWCGILMSNSYQNLYGIIYDYEMHTETVTEYVPGQINLNNLSFSLTPNEHNPIFTAEDPVTRDILVNALIEALNIVISLIGIAVSFMTLIIKSNINLLDDIKILITKQQRKKQ